MLRFWHDPQRKHSRLRAAIVAVITTSVLATTAWATTSLAGPAFATDDPSTTLDPSTLPPAPAGFTDQLVAVYESEYAVAQRLGVMDRGAQLPSVEDYSATVATLSADDLAVAYYATQKAPTWSQIPSLLGSVSISDTASTSGTASTEQSGGTLARTAAATSDRTAESTTQGTAQAAPSVWLPTVAPSGIDSILMAPTVTTTAATDFQPTEPVVEFKPEDCPFADIKASDIFALKIAAAAARTVYDTLDAAGALGSTAIPGIIAAVLFGALEISVTTLEYLSDQNSSCENDNLHGFVEATYNTTYQSWGLINTMNNTVTDLEATSNTINNNLLNVTNQITNLSTANSTEMDTQLTTVKNSIENIMANDTSTVLNLVQNVQSLVGSNNTSISTAQTTLNTAIIDARDSLAVRITTLSDSLGRAEDSLKNHITFQTERVLTRIDELKGQDTDHFEAALRVAIETALATGTSMTPVGVLQLPASAGGYLDAEPIGVKQIVTDILEGMKATHQSFNSGGVKYLNSANDALAAGRYKDAWLDYVTAYGFLNR
jgi:hypothetical protein